jgi:hypothetical protein
MPSSNPSSDPPRVPPQLIGIIDDARRESIDTFTLEYSRGLVMASFSASGHAIEIDFELEAGEEMMQYLRSAAPSPGAKQWAVRCTDAMEVYELLVQQTGITSKGPFRIKWSVVRNETST